MAESYENLRAAVSDPTGEESHRSTDPRSVRRRFMIKWVVIAIIAAGALAWALVAHDYRDIVVGLSVAAAGSGARAVNRAKSRS